MSYVVDVFTDIARLEVPDFTKFLDAETGIFEDRDKLLTVQPTECTYIEPLPSKHEPNFRHASYMEEFIVPGQLRERIQLAVRALHGWQEDFDAIAFRGMSGTLIGPPVALAMDKTMILVRKPNDDSHALSEGYGNHLVEGDAGARSYIILDDFKASGATYHAIEDAVRDFAPQAQCLGLLPVRYITEGKLDLASGGKYLLEKR